MSEQNQSPEAQSPQKPSAVERIDTASQPPMEEGGVLLGATLLLQCLGCGGQLVGRIDVEHPEQLNELNVEEVGCPTCTSKNGGRAVVIPVTAAAGLQVAALEELWESNLQVQQAGESAAAAPSEG